MQSYKHNKYIVFLLAAAIIISGMCPIGIPADSSFLCTKAEPSAAYINTLNANAALLEFRTSDSYQQTSFSEVCEFSFIRGLRSSKKTCTWLYLCGRLLPCTIRHFSSYSWEQDVQPCIISRCAILNYIHHQDGQKS